jgi:hypothetical protein
MSSDLVKLSESAEKEAAKILNRFASKMHDLASEILGDIGVKTLLHIETDAWMNYRSELRSELGRACMTEAQTIRTSETAWAKQIRDAIYLENKDEVRDGVVKSLEAEVDKYKGWYQELQNSRFR